MIACDRDRCLCQYGQPSNTYQRDGWDWPHGDEDDVAERISDRFAVLPDGLLLRLTPSGQPTVDEVLQPGTLIHASYHHEGRAFKVFRVREREYYGGIPAYTIALGDVGQEAREDGMPKNYRGANIKELVYQDGSIRKLFENNGTVLEVVGYDSVDVDYQATLATGWS